MHACDLETSGEKRLSGAHTHLYSSLHTHLVETLKKGVEERERHSKALITLIVNLRNEADGGIGAAVQRPALV